MSSEIFELERTREGKSDESGVGEEKEKGEVESNPNAPK